MPGQKTKKSTKSETKQKPAEKQPLLGSQKESNEAMIAKMNTLDANLGGGAGMSTLDFAQEVFGMGTGFIADKAQARMGGQDMVNAPKSKSDKKKYKAAMTGKTMVDAAGLIPGVNVAAHMTAGVAANTAARKAKGANKRQALGGALIDEGLASLKGLLPIYGQLDAINGVVADLRALKDGLDGMDADEALAEYRARLADLDQLEEALELNCNDADTLKKGQQVVAAQRHRLEKAITQAEKVAAEKDEDQQGLLANDYNDSWDQDSIFDAPTDQEIKDWETFDQQPDWA